MQQASDLWADRPMTGRQMLVIAMCCILNAFDGIDILAISFASPGIAAEWSISKAQLGVVLSMELIGMALGAAVLGHLADRFGRRALVLACLIVTSAGMWVATQASSVTMLSVIRFLTGCGIGGMIAIAHAYASEFSSASKRNFCIALVGVGWPIGAIVGGSLASAFISQEDWRHVFFAGAALSTLFLPIAWIAFPESVAYLLDRQPPNALARVNAVFRSLGHRELQKLPELASAVSARTGVTAPLLYGLTAALAAAYFFDSMTYYFLLKWSPKIVADLGFGAAAGASVLVWGTIGQFAALILTGWAATKISVRKLLPPALILTALGISAFGVVGPSLFNLKLVMAVGTFFNQAANSLLIMLLIESFPTVIRGGRVGLCMGIGRGGAALSPILAGVMLAQDVPLSIVTIALACPVLVTAGIVLALGRGAREAPVPQPAM
ncbi:MFS transporter [Sphingomonas aracearum]|nr:MFS transporter [Sphingomonas aracearum]